MHIVLYQPVIPQNTGSIARLCACTGIKLHLIHPLGFSTDSAQVKRAGLDYWEYVDIKEHDSWEAFLAKETPKTLYFFTKFAARPYHEVQFDKNAYLVFGSETKGLPKEIHTQYEGQRVWIPMKSDVVRSLNLAHSAAIASYEALRQNGFEDLLQYSEAPRAGRAPHLSV